MQGLRKREKLYFGRYFSTTTECHKAELLSDSSRTASEHITTNPGEVGVGGVELAYERGGDARPRPFHMRVPSPRATNS